MKGIFAAAGKTSYRRYAIVIVFTICVLLQLQFGPVGFAGILSCINKKL